VSRKYALARLMFKFCAPFSFCEHSVRKMVLSFCFLASYQFYTDRKDGGKQAEVLRLKRQLCRSVYIDCDINSPARQILTAAGQQEGKFK